MKSVYSVIGSKQIASENSLANWTVILAGNDTVKMINQAEDSHHWIAAGYQLGKVNRSRRKPKDDMDMVIDIGALRALRDHIADIDPHYVKGANNLAGPCRYDTKSCRQR